MATYSAGFSNSELPSTDSLTLTDLASPVCSVSSSKGVESRQKTESPPVGESLVSHSAPNLGLTDQELDDGVDFFAAQGERDRLDNAIRARLNGEKK